MRYQRVSALTSPLHGLWCALLEVLTGNPLAANKVAGAVIVLFAMLWSNRVSLRAGPFRDLVLLVVLGCPFLAFWTVGGLETGLLAATLAVLMALYVTAIDGPPEPRRLLAVSLLASVAFALRYDSVLFTAPVVAHLLWRQRQRSAILYLLPAAAGLGLFLTFWYRFFDTLLPTSFYVKSPATEGNLLRGGLYYEASYFILLLGALWIRWPLRASVAFRVVSGSVGGASIGLALVAAYAISAGTVHMMFGYRMLVPYLAVFSIWFGRILETEDPPGAARLAIASLLPPSLLAIIWTVSLNPSVYDFVWARPRNLPAPVEFARLPLSGYFDYLDALRLNAVDLAADWQHRDGVGAPVLTTYAGGVVPYLIGDAYTYEQLISFRLHCPAVGLHDTVFAYAGAANYVQLIIPEVGSIEAQIGSLAPRLQLISRRSFDFTYGDEMPVETQSLVFWNPDPHPLHLPETLGGVCAIGTVPATAETDHPLPE